MRGLGDVETGFSVGFEYGVSYVCGCFDSYVTKAGCKTLVGEELND